MNQSSTPASQPLGVEAAFWNKRGFECRHVVCNAIQDSNSRIELSASAPQKISFRTLEPMRLPRWTGTHFMSELLPIVSLGFIEVCHRKCVAIEIVDDIVLRHVNGLSARLRDSDLYEGDVTSFVKPKKKQQIFEIIGNSTDARGRIRISQRKLWVTLFENAIILINAIRSHETSGFLKMPITEFSNRKL